MRKPKSWRRWTCALSLVWAANAQSGIAWDESINGDLSGNGLAPTPVAVGLGGNEVMGETGNPGTGIDRDYFTIVVPAGTRLTSIRLLPNTFVSGASSFMGMQAGPQVTVTPTGGGSQALLGFVHYSNDQIGTDILPVLAPTFAGGLPSGTYSVWVQELGGVVSYGFDFVITPTSSATSDAPLPLWTYAALGSVLLWLGSRRASRRGVIIRWR